MSGRGAIYKRRSGRESKRGFYRRASEFDAINLNKALKEDEKERDTLIEIVGTRGNSEIQSINADFQRMFGEKLEDVIAKKEKGDFKDLLVGLLKGNRSQKSKKDMMGYDPQKDAEKLYNAGEGKIGTNEKTFIQFFTEKSKEEMTMINECYSKKYGKELEKAIGKEFTGLTKKLLITVLKGLTEQASYLAERIHGAISKNKTDDEILRKNILFLSEMDKIKEAYSRMFKKDILTDLNGVPEEDYKRILLCLMNKH